MSHVFPASEEPADLDGLFRRYNAELNGLAYSRLKDRDAAQDIVQDAFVRLLRRATVEPLSAIADAPRFFLRKVVSNLTIDAMRRDHRQGARVDLEAVAETLPDLTPSAERSLVACQEYARLKAALDELPLAARASLLLNRIEGLTHVEIGARLGISASMVSKHIMNALRHCLRRMGAAR